MNHTQAKKTLPFFIQLERASLGPIFKLNERRFIE